MCRLAPAFVAFGIAWPGHLYSQYVYPCVVVLEHSRRAPPYLHWLCAGCTLLDGWVGKKTSVH